MPVSVGLEQPVLGVHAVDAFDTRRLPDRKPPVIRRDVLTQIGQRAAEAQGFVEGFLQQRAPGRTFHHRRGHVQRGDDAVLRRGRDVHHECFIETITIQLPRAAVLHMNHRGLTERRQHLVRGMGGKHQRTVFAARSVHAIAPGEELVKRRIGVPGLVEMQHFNTIAQALFDQFGVVTEPVVGRIGDHREFHFRCAALGQRTGVDLGLDRFAAEFAERNRADNPQFITFRAQVQRDRAGHDDRVQHRLVAVAIHQHQIIASDHRMPDDLVGGRGAIDHEKRVVGSEVASCAGFCLGERTGVIKQRTEFRHRH
ncbi:hypothetical protein PS718_05629 [Pseudomonas fluorescens]|uniref:Uncharacterized protein n=1 Tax=Pseudomonas fluorescens TaxID=294 RepID=A0A5E7FJF4_PSEFL|nr:hypothetical protein PS718_05629 [Pseudomonas fluorescens]